MLYLIGGVYRTGKTTLAQHLLEKKSVPFASTDSLFHMVKNAAPELGLDDKIPLDQKVADFFPFLEQFARYVLYSSPSYAIEGDVIWPAQVAELQKAHPTRAVFLGFSEIDVQKLREHAGHNNWIGSLNAEELQDLADRMVGASHQLLDECKRFKFKYVDLAGEYKVKHEEALDHLIG